MQKDKTELEVTRMTKENIQYLDVFFAVCKRYKVDYYHATEKQRAFIDAVAAHEFSMKQAHEKGLNRSSAPPFMGIKCLPKSALSLRASTVLQSLRRNSMM